MEHKHMEKIPRRTFIVGSAAVVGTSAVALTGLPIVGPRISTGRTDSSVTPADHQTPLAIPPLNEGEVLYGVRQFHLSLQEGKTEFKPG
jgi:hypothetical protein